MRAEFKFGGSFQSGTIRVYPESEAEREVINRSEWVVGHGSYLCAPDGGYNECLVLRAEESEGCRYCRLRRYQAEKIAKENEGMAEECNEEHEK